MGMNKNASFAHVAHLIMVAMAAIVFAGAADAADEEMRRIDRMLNDRPLKCLGWRTPREAFVALLHRYLLAAA